MVIDTGGEAQETEVDTPGWQFAIGAGVLGWVLDAFDFFVLIFLFDELSSKFHVGKAAIVASLTLTLAMRPVGALIFGAMADRFGRKKPLIACVVYFSTITVLSGFAPSYGFFLAMRALYGIGMGGYWGIGASFAMESAPRRMRGLLSGLMQGGYPFGYLCAAVGMQTVAVRFGWQAMFLIGSVVAVGIVILTLLAPESEAWKMQGSPSLTTMFATLWQHKKIFGYMLALMSVITCLSHGTQDLYPDFLKTLPFMKGAKILGMTSSYGVPVLYNIGAIVGTLSIGALSEKIGRRRAVMISLVICLLAIPAWAFGASLMVIVVGSCFMQAGVQGTFGVIPAHLNELSPAAVRGLFPGFVYQLGVLVSSGTPWIEHTLEGRYGYSWALTSFELCVILALMAIFWFGPEARGKDFRAG